MLTPDLSQELLADVVDSAHSGTAVRTLLACPIRSTLEATGAPAVGVGFLSVFDPIVAGRCRTGIVSAEAIRSAHVAALTAVVVINAEIDFATVGRRTVAIGKASVAGTCAALPCLAGRNAARWSRAHVATTTTVRSIGAHISQSRCAGVGRLSGRDADVRQTFRHPRRCSGRFENDAVGSSWDGVKFKRS